MELLAVKARRQTWLRALGAAAYRLTVDGHRAPFRHRPMIDFHAAAREGKCPVVSCRTVQHVPTVEEPACRVSVCF